MTTVPLLVSALAFMVTSLLIWVGFKIRQRRDYPPGPFPLPIIGNLHLLRKDIHLSMDRLSKQYGSMYTLWMAHIPYIVITDIKLAKKVTSTRTFADRLPLYVGKYVYTRGAKDIIMADYGKQVVLHRKLAQSTFRMFGEGMVTLENRILSIIESLVVAVDSRLGDHTYNISDDLDLTSFNIMSAIVLGTGMTKEDERYQKIRNAIFYMMQSGVTLSMINFYPILRYLPNADLREMTKVLGERDQVLKSILHEAEATFTHGQTVTNYVQGLLKTRFELECEHGEGYIDSILSRDHLELNIFDMFLGGVETVSSTLRWAILYFMKWPAVQENCYDEIYNTLNRHNDSSGLITLKYKQEMPYIQATIMETLRLASTLPFGVFHKARENAVVNGYDIKKGTATMVNLWTIHHDERNYTDPLVFKPERFLNGEGQLLAPSQRTHFFAFSSGPRECIGQSLAKTELFLILTNILYRYRFQSSSLNDTLDIYGTTKVTHAPNPYKVFITQRVNESRNN